MPDEKGNLSQDEVKKIATHLNGLTEGRPQICPVCGDTNWSIGGRLVQPPAIGSQFQYHFGFPAYPLIALISPKCGYTRFINAVVAGIVPPADEKQPEL